MFCRKLLPYSVRRLCFYLIETFPVNADDIGLGYESMIVDLLHETENTVRFGTFGQYDDYFFGLFGVPARAVENRYAPVYVMVYAIGYLLVFVGEDKELYRLSYTVDNQVARISRNG